MPDFVTRMLGLESKIDKVLANEEKLKAAEAKVTSLEAKVAAAEGELAKLKAESPDGDVAIITKARDDAQAELAAKTAELEAAKTKAAADLEEAKNKANAVLASMGFSPDQLPAAGQPTSTPGGRNPDVIAELRSRLMKSTDPKEKFVLSEKIRALLSPAPKKA